MIPAPNLPPKTRLLIDELRGQGITPTDSEIVWLFQLGENVVKPPTTSDKDLANLGHCMGDVQFFPLTIGARIWLAEYGLPAIPEESEYVSFLFAFASVHARQPEIFRNLCNEDAILDHVLSWAQKTLGKFLPENLEDALDVVFPVDPIEPPPRATDDAGDSGFSHAISRVCDEVGGTPESWLWEYPLSVVMDQITYIGIKDASAAGENVTPAASPGVKALQCLMYAGDVILTRNDLPAKYLPDRIANA